MPPLKGEEACEHVERVSAIAWANGAYKSTEALETENARLKAEVERLTERNQFLEQVDSYLQSANLYAEEQRSLELEAQVERLTKERDKALTDFWYIHEGYFRLQAEVNRLTAFTTRTIIPNKELQAQVDRLTKAGDAMAIRLIRCEERFNGIESAEAQMWYIAKEGGCP